MIRFELAFGLMTLALWIYCLVDVISRGDGEIRNLPKLWWILLVLFFPLAGSVAYLVAGRPQGSPRTSPHERAVPEFPEYDRPGAGRRHPARARRGVPAQGARACGGAAPDPPGGRARAGSRGPREDAAQAAEERRGRGLSTRAGATGMIAP